MAVVVGYLPTAEGDAALERGIHEASLRGERMIVVNASRSDPLQGDGSIAGTPVVERVRHLLGNAGVDYEFRQPMRGRAPADELIHIAEEDCASLIVIGLRRRSPVGKMLFGSTAQTVLLEASCPVIAVKPQRRTIEQAAARPSS